MISIQVWRRFGESRIYSMKAAFYFKRHWKMDVDLSMNACTVVIE